MTHLNSTLLLLAACLLIQCNVTSSGGGSRDDEKDKEKETGTVADVDGNEYKTIVIGEQEWMAENLRVTHYRDGTEIPTGLSDTEWENTTQGAYAVYEHEEDDHRTKPRSSEMTAVSSHMRDDPGEGVEGIDRIAGTEQAYTMLYNWYALNDSPGLCPAGWRVATDEDFKALEMYWGMTEEEADAIQWRGGEENVGGKMKATGTDYWNTPNAGATNESGFEGLPDGFRDTEGEYGERGQMGFWWTASQGDRDLALERRLVYDEGSVYRGMSHKNNGYSVRCVLEEEDPGDDDNDYDDDHEYGSVTDIDGNEYKTIVIGDQEWMAHNLRTTKYNNGNDILTGLNDDDWGSTRKGAYAIYDHEAENTNGIDSPEEMVEIYGLLYNRYAIEQDNLCPADWAVPEREDWQELIEHLNNEYEYSNHRDDPRSVGQALKVARQVNHPHGDPYNTDEHPRWDSHSTHYGLDRFGFSGLPAGIRSSSGNYGSMGIYAYWWSSTDEDLSPMSSPFTSMWYGHNYMQSSAVIDDRSGLSVRCIRVDSQDDPDEATLPDLRTTTVSEITATTAVSGGEVTDDGGATVTARGVVWSTSQNPTTDRNQGMTSDGSGTGVFESHLSDLDPETTYYVRAYATNSEGAAYGNQLDFTTSEDDSDDISTKSSFIAMHWDEDSDERPYFSVLNINNGELDYTHLTDVYPYRHRFKQAFHQANGVLGFTLHRDLTETTAEGGIRWTGVWMDMRDGEVHELPTLNACTDFGYDSGCDRYSKTQRNSVRIGKSGHVFYVAMSQYEYGGWHQEPRYRIIRLDPQTGEYEMSPLISSWTNGQPEIDADRYGLASISDLFPSVCGRYVYGRTAAWGISGGNLIASHALLFRYDLDTEKYSRVDEVPYNIILNGITADDRYILYNNRNDRNNYRYDTQTGQSTLIEEAGIGYSYQTMMHNNGGIGGAYPLRQLWHGHIIEDKTYKIPVPNHPDRPMFSADGTQVYFRYRDCENNYLLRLNELTEEATVDTVATLTPNVRVMTVY